LKRGDAGETHNFKFQKNLRVSVTLFIAGYR